jgi:hypothetical protein
MSRNERDMYVSVRHVAVGKGMSATQPVDLDLPKMQDHITVELKCAEFSIFAQMSLETAKHLKEQLSLYA